MKVSRYNIQFQEKGIYFVYNALSTSILSIPHDLALRIESGQIDDIKSSEFEILKENGIIVDNSLDERKVYEHFYRTVQYGAAEQELRIVVLPTFKCNLHCSYCFETSSETIRLNETSLAPIISFTLEELRRRKYTSLRLVLFGGEPLICKDVCISLASSLQNIISSANMSFHTQIITNGILLDESIIHSLIIPFNMRVQLTIDGKRETHDAKRVFHTGQGTYDLIKDKILLLNRLGCKELIDLRINVDKNNVNEFSDVYKEFMNLCGYIYPGLLRPIGGNACNAESCIEDNDYTLHIRPQLYLQMGSNAGRNSFGKKKPCGFNRSNSYIITPSLDVYKCENLVGQKRYSIGTLSISGELLKNSEYYKQLTWSPFDFRKCIDCKLLPACASECPFQGLIENGTYEKPLCSSSEAKLVKALKLYVLGNE